MREIKFNVYSYNELSEDAKENALRNFPVSLMNDEMQFAYDDEKSYMQDVALPERGFDDVKIGYQNRSGWYDISLFVDREKLEELTGYKFDDYYDTVKIEYINNSLYGFDYYPEDMQTEECDKAYDAVLEMMQGISEDVRISCNKASDYVYDDDWKIEMMENNDFWEFTEDGDWYY